LEGIIASIEEKTAVILIPQRAANMLASVEAMQGAGAGVGVGAGVGAEAPIIRRRASSNDSLVGAAGAGAGAGAPIIRRRASSNDPWLGQWVLERVREWALEWERALE